MNLKNGKKNMDIKNLPKNLKLKMLSVIYTYDCAKQPRCSFCYLKKEQFVRKLLEQNVSFSSPGDFYNPMTLLKVTQQVAIAYNGLGIYKLQEWLSECRNCNVVANITTNPEFITPQILALFKRYKVKMVALSLDPEKCSVKFWIKKARETINATFKVGTNILMLDEVFKSIDETLKLINPYCQQIHLLRPKFYQTKISMEDRRELIFLLKQKYKNLFIDECFKWEFTGEPCKRGKDFMSVNPDGTISLCSFDIYRENGRNIKKCPYI